MSILHTGREDGLVREPPFIRWFLDDPRAGWFWLPFRAWLGWHWIRASQLQIQDRAWMRTGSALEALWRASIEGTDGERATVAFDWYRSCVQALLNAHAQSWMAPAITIGEMVIGVALVLGAFTAIAAFLGSLLNWSYMSAGTVGGNPGLFVVAVGLIVAWKVSGYIGLDYFLLPRIGTPWSRAEQSGPSATIPVDDAVRR